MPFDNRANPGYPESSGLPQKQKPKLTIESMTDQARRELLASGDLLSIAQASKRTSYSAEYLSYLARKEKLAAVKIARNWVTTASAVAEYVSKQQNRHQAIIARLGASRKEPR